MGRCSVDESEFVEVSRDHKISYFLVHDEKDRELKEPRGL